MKKFKIIMLVLFLIVSIGVTYAYYTSSDTIPNEFFVGDFYVIIEEEFEEGQTLGYDENIGEFITNIPKKVYVSNEENTGAIVRVSYNEYMTMNQYNGNPYLYVTNNLKDGYDRITKNWTDDFYYDWIYKDGWFYYRYVLPPNSRVQILESIDCSTDYTYIEDNYNLDFNLEAVQATSEAVNELWGLNVTISDDGYVDWRFIE